MEASTVQPAIRKVVADSNSTASMDLLIMTPMTVTGAMIMNSTLAVELLPLSGNPYLQLSCCQQPLFPWLAKQRLPPWSSTGQPEVPNFSMVMTEDEDL